MRRSLRHRLIRWGWTILAVAGSLCVPAPVEGAAGSSLDWSHPWVMPRDGAAAIDASDEYAWRLFVALNWPVTPGSRVPDLYGSFGKGPVLWESWPGSKGVFRQDGADPGDWFNESDASPESPANRFDGLPVMPGVPIRRIVNGAMATVSDPIEAASRLSETHFNEASFGFIRAQRLYNLKGQMEAARREADIRFPEGSQQVKALWQPVNPADAGRYFTEAVTFADGRQQLYGLVALHIASKDLPNWFWATFEHVDNGASPDLHSGNPPLQDRFACGAVRPDCNRAPAGVGLEGTVWANYRLRGTMIRFTDDRGTPLVLANSKLESRVRPDHSSCITCHSRASIGLDNGQAVRLPIFADGASDDAAMGHDGSVLRTGYIGLPQASWFSGPSQGSSSGSGRAFAPLDFVWSLRNAKGLP